MEIAPSFVIPKKFEQFSNNYLTHCAQSAKIILTIRNNPCKNMGDILGKGVREMLKIKDNVELKDGFNRTTQSITKLSIAFSLQKFYEIKKRRDKNASRQI